MDDMNFADDPFEGFEVESGSEKEFLIAHLRNDAPEDAAEQFRQAGRLCLAKSSVKVEKQNITVNQRRSKDNLQTARFENDQTVQSSWDYPAAYLMLRKRVEDFARSHIFAISNNVRPTALQWREFTRDIYDYARAVGMGRHQADVEKMRAKAAYRYDRGLPGGLLLDQSDDESTLGLEINDMATYALTENGVQQGPICPAAAWQPCPRLQAKMSHSSLGPKRLKGDILDNRSVGGNGLSTRQASSDGVLKASKKREREKLIESHVVVVDQAPSELADKSELVQHNRRRKNAKRRMRSNLRRLAGTLNIKSDHLAPENRTAEISLIQHCAENADEVDQYTEQHEHISNKGANAVKAESLRKAKTESFEANNHNVYTDASGDPRDLRQRKKKKKKRKRKIVDGNRTVSLDSKAKAEPHNNSNATISLFKDPPNIHYDRELRSTGSEEGKDRFNREIANNNNLLKPLSELMSANSNEKLLGRRDRGKRKKKITGKPDLSKSITMDGKNRLAASQSLTSGNPSMDLGPQEQDIGTVEIACDSSRISDASNDNLQVSTTVAHSPETKCEVIIPSPSKTWRSHVLAGSLGKAESIDFDSSTSVLESTFSEATGDHTFTMSKRSVDWNHSGPEFDRIKVEPKVTGSSPLKLKATTPTKAARTRNSSDSFQTPTSDKKTRKLNRQSSQTPVAGEPELHEACSVPKKPVKALAKSPFFSPPASAEKLRTSPKKKSRPRGGLVSCIPFPPLRSAAFGLLQEKLYQDPFRLLIGVTFLNRTMGKHAIPVFFSLMERYPTPAAILAAEKEEIISMTRHLGFQAQRAETYKKFAHFWVHDPPVKGKRYRVDHYPSPGDGMDIKAGEIVDDEDLRVAWEIGHMTKGRYAIDSWRIFCRDILRGEAEGWNGEGREDGFQPEWMRVQPRDKELIACLRWMWLKEGFSWDPVTGEKEVADRELMEAAIAGKIVWDDMGGMRIIDDDDNDSDDDPKIKGETS